VSVTATLSTTAPAKVNADVLAVPVFSGRVLGPGGKALDAVNPQSLGGVRSEYGDPFCPLGVAGIGKPPGLEDSSHCCEHVWGGSPHRDL